MDANKFVSGLMSADFCSDVLQSDGYRNLTSERQQEINRWLKSNKGKNYFSNELSRQGSEQETYSGINRLMDGLDTTIQNIIEQSFENVLSKHNCWQPVA